jgi:hypothetical protein
MHTTI